LSNCDDKEGVLDRLADSNQIQAIQCKKSLPWQSKKLLEQMANLRGLGAIALGRYDGDCSVLSQNRSLRVLSLNHCMCALLDCSPVLKALSPQYRILLQEWRRTDPDHQFQLTKLWSPVSVPDQVWKLLPLETHLEELAAAFSQTLLDVFPRCRSIRSLDISTESNEQMASLSKALLLAPFIDSLSLAVDSFACQNLSSLPITPLKSFKLISDYSFREFSNVLTNSKPKSLTTLELSELNASLDPLGLALIECPSLHNLTIAESTSGRRDLVPALRALQRLPIVRLTLEIFEKSDESISCLLSSVSAVQDLKLGSLSPKQLQLVVDALPSLPRLQSLDFDTARFHLCEHDSASLALFSALTRSSLRSLTLRWASFRFASFKACVDKIPETQLTRFRLVAPVVYADGFDPKKHGRNYKYHDLEGLIAWERLFPRIKDRFCFMTLSFSD
jgi:hypothetical protein